jgi:hypothetical protein
MTKLYAIFSSRGMWIEVLQGTKKHISTKRAALYGRAEAERIAGVLSAEHKRKYWVEEVDVIVAPKD